MKIHEMHRLAVFLPPADHERLQAMAQAEARSVGRQAQKLILDALRQPEKREDQASAA
jgi:hypothetical protein